MTQGRSSELQRGHRSNLFAQVDTAAADFAFWLAAAGYIVFSLADCLTTAYVLARGGHERNPIASSLYASYGIGALFAFKAAVVAVILLTLRYLPRRPAVWVATAFTVTVALTVVANLGAFSHVR